MKTRIRVGWEWEGMGEAKGCVPVRFLFLLLVWMRGLVCAVSELIICKFS